MKNIIRVGLLLSLVGLIVAIAVVVLAPDARGRTLRVAGVWSGPEQERFREVLNVFERQSHVEVEFVSLGDKLVPELRKQIRAGTAPDIAMLAQPGLLRRLVYSNSLIPLDQDTSKLVHTNYAPEWSKLGSVDERLYGVWFRASNKSAIWYRPQSFTERDIDTPSSWDELKQVAETLSKNGVVPFALGGADGWPITDWFENIYIRTAGLDSYDKLARREISWTDVTVRRALAIMAEVLGRSEWLGGGITGALGTNFDNSVIEVFGEPPSATMLQAPDFVQENIVSDTPARLDVSAKFFDFPTFTGGDFPTFMPGKSPVVAGGDVAVLLKKGKEARASKEAMALMTFLATPEAAEPWVRAGGFTSPNRALDVRLYSEFSRPLALPFSTDRPFRFDLSDFIPASCGASPNQGMWRIFQDFLRTPADVGGIAQRLQDCHAVAVD